MNKIDFYDTLDGEVPQTIDVNGVVLAWENKGKWHVCKKADTSVSYVCGSGGGPTNPHRTGYTSDDYYKEQFKRNAKTVSVKQFLELGTICKNCQRIVENEYNLVRVISAVPTDETPSVWKELSERFIRRASEKIESRNS